MNRRRLTGVCPPARGLAVAEVVASAPAALWCVLVPTRKEAETLAEDAALFLATLFPKSSVETLLLPESMPDGADMREAFSASSERLAVLSRLGQAAERGYPGPGLLLCGTTAAFSHPVPPRREIAEREIALRRGQRQPFSELVAQLAQLDYDSEAVCEAPGQYAVRGGILDVYPVTADKPYRLDFFGDDIEDIRELDPVTQRSGAAVDAVSIGASPRLAFASAAGSLLDYLPPDFALLAVEPARLEEGDAKSINFTDTPSGQSAFSGPEDDGGLSDPERGDGERPGPPTARADTFTPAPAAAGASAPGPASSRAGDHAPAATRAGGFLPALAARCARLVGVGDLDEASWLFEGAEIEEETWDTDSLSHHRAYPSDNVLAHERLQYEEEARARFLRQAADWKKAGAELFLVLARDGEEQRIAEILAADPCGKKLKPKRLKGPLAEGFRHVRRDGAPARVFITETEILGRRRPRRSGGRARAGVARHQVDQLLDFSELVEGDFVVHLQHGIAVYRGLSRIEMRDGFRETISLEFDDHVILHVPLQESHLISRYVGLSKTHPQLGRIGSNRWEKARRAAEQATIDLAAELLRIHAMREAQPGFASLPDNTWQHEFEASFPYTETRDQLRAIEETKADMERTRPMDRLICGDVGYGKTEVAIRAAFKAVQSGRQVAVLVPTTVLAQQHLNTFRERMAGYPIVIEMVSRFRSRAEHGKILAATAAGQVDILIGTHRLLQRDVSFKELGLVVVDEEQRFGVKHKEALKRMRATVDFLTLSATPIPRTLYLALTGARDMSVIETPPVDRLPIQTLVKTYDEKLVCDAIRFEINRGGQVFYLHNRVLTIEALASRLRQLLPDLRISVGHGQMDADDLERVMTDFVAGQADVLVCTTIIESGLDIPNCNTLIIEGADRFGLSQLYQLRGRVGRFKHQAYAYLLLHRHTRLLDIARQRLAALRQHSQLGAGFRIAMRDLELRGAGNLLGAEQSGHIAGVGFELYCQLLRQSVARLKGEPTASRVRASVKLDFVFVGDGSPDPEGAQRNAYQDGYTAVRDAEDAASGAVAVALIQARIPVSYLAETRLRIDLYRRLALAESLPQLQQLEKDLRDRFGRYGDEVKALLLVTEIRIRAEQKGLLSVETDGNRLKLLRASGRRDDWVMLGTRFPRLTAPKPLLRLREIVTFLNNLA